MFRVVIQVVQDDNPWLGVLKENVEWLLRSNPELTPLINRSVDQWITFALGNRSRWTRLIRVALAAGAEHVGCPASGLSGGGDGDTSFACLDCGAFF